MSLKEKRPRDASDDAAPEKSTKASWMGAPGDAGSSLGGPSPAELLQKTEVKKIVSTITSKLSQPKLLKGSVQDARKLKVGSFSAGLTKDKILESQARFAAHEYACSSHLPKC